MRVGVGRAWQGGGASGRAGCGWWSSSSAGSTRTSCAGFVVGCGRILWACLLPAAAGVGPGGLGLAGGVERAVMRVGVGRAGWR
jgi:hypothetical protein